MKHYSLSALTVLICLFTGCENKPQGTSKQQNSETAQLSKAVVLPELAEGKSVNGVTVHKMTVDRNGSPMQLWVYLPKGYKESTGKFPCIFIAPAGSTTFVGMELTDEDSEEHFPYTQKGYVVVSYSLDGYVPKHLENEDEAIIKAVKKYKLSNGGLDNAKVAIDFATTKLNVDTDRLIMAGHSSSATHSLFVARKDKRIKTCIAYAPALDLVSHIEPIVPIMERDVPGFREFIKSISPYEFPKEPACPTFYFQAKDDFTCKFKVADIFTKKLGQHNKQLKFMVVPTGGHYESMSQVGIPSAIEWLSEIHKQK